MAPWVVPALPILTADVVGPDINKGPHLLYTIWILLGVSTTLVALRCFVKLKVTHRIFWDDALLLLALLCGYQHAIVITEAVRSGLGRHIAYLDYAQLTRTLRVGLFSFAGGFLSPAIGRISFCVFLLCVAGGHKRIKAWPLYFFIGLQVVINCVSVILIYSQCGSEYNILFDPIRIFSMPKYCLDPRIQTWWGYTAGSLNSLTDLFLTVFPAVLVSFSKLSMQSRLGLISLLCLSFVAMIASIKKTFEAKVLSQYTDYTFNLVELVIWMSVEINVVIIASTIPLLRPLFKRNGLSSVIRRDVQEMATYDSKPFTAISKKDIRQASSISSEEDILPCRPMAQFVINKTVEVSVTRHIRDDKTFLHAALIGLPLD